MKRVLILSLGLLVALTSPLSAVARDWAIVSGESRVEVDVSWLGAVLTLRFDTIRGDISFDEDAPENAKASIAVVSRRVDAGAGIINAYVKGEGYLDVKNHPEIGFQLDRLLQTSPSTARIFGRMTFLGVTQPVSFNADVFRYGATPGAPDRFDAGFDLSGVVDRRLFGHTTGLPHIAAELPVRIRLLMRSE